MRTKKKKRTMSSLSFAYECRRTTAVTMLHTARRRRAQCACPKTYVGGWVVGGRYDTWVDYICMYIFHGGVSARGAAARPCSG